jgi:hypothetical protein
MSLHILMVVLCDKTGVNGKQVLQKKQLMYNIYYMTKYTNKFYLQVYVIILGGCKH